MRDKAGDGFFRNRLFLTEKIGLNIYEIQVIRPHVLKINTSDGTFIVKGFESKKKLEAQIQLARLLKYYGSSHHISFHKLRDNLDYFWSDQKFWAVMPYVKPIRNFTYSRETDRLNGVKRLIQFHDDTGKVRRKVRELFDSYCLLSKWRERYLTFTHYSSYIMQWIDYQSINTITNIGYWVLEHLSERDLALLEGEAKQAASLIHGDCAEHNFILNSTGVYLIDYDLVARAPYSYDLLQFANRILPYLEWSLEELEKIEPFSHLIQQQWFITALMFPTDIYREWNRHLRQEKPSVNKLRSLQQWTQNEVKQRKKFVEKIQAMVR
ncbi:phosphotransferase [Bacillus solimangrovi]|uniref:Aminoglycoside phosphotransferase domain-containing protein n=1 Tax=Bacillus solimangrovi TaxID=1305675 RepID=A0A1E5LBW6_9BACI|nr:phosphotransferase [Bacillus solimangrovi]OEH91479.1 hypothetical protein BFG57_05020 [Bacillus solimangrovi]